MRLLLDTHVFVWWVAHHDGGPIPERTHRLIDDPDNEVFVSSASVYEIVYKYVAGKWGSVAELALDVPGAVAQSGFQILSITGEDMARAARLPFDHRDPFDRMISAQALSRDLVLVTRDGAIARHFGVAITWD